MQVKCWKVANYDDGFVKELAKTTKLPLIVCKVIGSRNPKSTPEDILKYLNSEFEFESPFNLKDMDIAVERIFRAIEEQEKIAIYGDYDCDGITSTALMLNYFQSVGADVFHYIPQRESEGYGINIPAIDYLSSVGTDLIITVDNGISSIREIDYANTLGIDTVITDHHTPRETLPKAVAVINPHRSDCKSKFKDYAGVGVAFQLVCALEDADPLELLDYYADLVTVGTVADLVPLYNENRTIVNKGIENIREGNNVGITALLEVANIKNPITSEAVSFGVSPRINAAGRVGNVDEAVELLVTEDPERATEIAESLNRLNIERRGIEENVIKEIENKLLENPEILLERLLIISGKNWHQGVMGIVASRLLERFGKPTIVFSESEDGLLKGSGRSLEGFSLIEAITHCNEKLLHYGGHTLAAGMTIKSEDLEDFKNSIYKYAKDKHEIMPVPRYNIDCELKAYELNVENIRSLDILAPFGSGNTSPIFVLKNVEITGIYPTADEKHLRLKLDFQGEEINAIYFRMSVDKFPYKEGSIVDTVVDIDVNEWNGNQQLSVKIKDVRSSGYLEEQAIISSQVYLAYKRGESSNRFSKSDLLPSRDEQEKIYKFLRKVKEYKYDELYLWEELSGNNINLAKLMVTLDIFIESGLIARENGKYILLPQEKKIDITNTKTYKDLKE